MFVLEDKKLEKVAGGTDRESKIRVKVDLTDCGPFDNDITIIPYLDGVCLFSQKQVVEASCEYVNLIFVGRGMALLTVQINEKIIKNYDIDFERGSYIQL